MKIGIFNNYTTNLIDNGVSPIGSENIMAYSDNIGNIVFLESIMRQTGAIPISIYDFMNNPTDFHFDILILSLANFISPVYTLPESFICALEETKIPIVIFSVGIQCNSLYDLENMEISETALRILKLSEKSNTTIGLRGEFTKKYLDKIGFYNTQVIGCPSLFYEKVIPKKVNISPQKIIINGSFNGNWRERLKDLFYFGVKYNTDYLVQSESRVLVDKYNISDDMIDGWHISEERKKYLKNRTYDYGYYLHDKIDIDAFRKWMVNNSFFYSDFDMWKNSMNYDMSVGVRFHGSVMSTLNGVPSMVLRGDSRVEEFVLYHKLPNMDLNDFTDKLNPMDIYDMIDYKEYEYRYDDLRSNYISYLEKNKLKFILNASR